jgi:hypothetical protein
VQVLRKIRKIILVILLPAVLLLLANSVLNRHNHFIHGFLYSHAHPFQNSGGPEPVKHTHTDFELLVLDLLSNLELIVGICFISLFLSERLLKQVLKPEWDTSVKELVVAGPPRAPPCFY